MRKIEGKRFLQRSLTENTTGVNNTAIGPDALKNNTVGSRNLGIGFESLKNNISGNKNFSLGVGTMLNKQSGDGNVAIGDQALMQNVNGSHNIAVGELALSSSVGNENIALGKNSGKDFVEGNGNVFLGNAQRSEVSAGMDNSIVIGNGISNHQNIADNSVILGGTEANNGLNVGIGVYNPQAKLDVAGKVRIADGTQGVRKLLTSDANGVASWGGNLDSIFRLGKENVQYYCAQGSYQAGPSFVIPFDGKRWQCAQGNFGYWVYDGSRYYALEYVMYENLTDRLNFDIVGYGIDGTRFEMGKGFIITITDQ